MKKYLILLFTLVLFGLGYAQKSVQKLPIIDGKTVKGTTCCYMLPTTGFKVTVSITKIQEIKGHYADYAEELLGLTDIISENRTLYKVKEVAIEPVQLPDFEQAYLVELSSNQIKANYLTQNSNQRTLTSEFNQGTKWYTIESTPVPNFFKNYADPSYTEMEDAFVETKIIDGVVTQIPANRSRLVSKTSDRKAQEAADAISKSRKDQYNLVAGEQETTYSAEAIALMLDELKQWEENYLSLFTGLTLEDEILYTFYVIPDGEHSCPLFSFDQTQGISLDNLSGESVYQLDFKPTMSTQSQQLEEMLRSAQHSKTSKASGYRYRCAMPVNVRLSFKGKELHNYGEFNMHQYGRILTLPTGHDTIDLNQIGFLF